MNIIEHNKNGLVYLTADGFEAAGGVAHGFSTRLGGVSEGIYATLNLGMNRGDAPDRVRENYRRFCAAIGADMGNIVCASQVHGDTVRTVTAADLGIGLDEPEPWQADGLVTDIPGVTLAVYSADCLPILLYDPVRRVVGAVHAGWRGTALGIAQADDLSGPLTLAFTMLTLNDTGCTGRFDSRTPLTATQASVQTVAEAALRAAGFAVQGDMDPPHYVPESDPFLRTLAQCYEAYTGQKGQCLAIGGGTYVHDIPGGVAFGPNMPGFVSNLHGPDEKIRVADLLTTAKIYAQVMVALCL